MWRKLITACITLFFAFKLTAVETSSLQYCVNKHSSVLNSIRYHCFNYVAFPQLEIDHYISEIDLGGFAETGKGGNNTIKTVFAGTLENFPFLFHLRMDHCKIEHVENGAFKGGNRTELLSLRNNLLREIDLEVFSELPNLNELDLSNNPLGGSFKETTEFPGTSLTKLGLRNCSLSSVPPNLFKNLEGLEFLDLAGNHLTNIDVAVFCPLKKSLHIALLFNNQWNCDCRILELVRFFHENTIVYEWHEDSVPKCSSASRNILAGKSWREIEQNNVQCDPPLLNSNQCPGESEEQTDNTTEIGKCKWRIFIHNFTWMHGYECTGYKNIFPTNFSKGNDTFSLDLGNYWKNSIRTLKDLELQHLPNLNYLDLRRCQIRSIKIGAFHGGDSIQSLLLSSNKLKFLDPKVFAGLLGLKTLDLEMNPIKEFRKDSQFPKLGIESLNLEGCGLRHININLFENLKNLRMLSLNNNRLTSLGQNAVFKMLPTLHIDLEHNPWHCDCHMRPYLEFIKVNNVSTASICYTAPSSSNSSLVVGWWLKDIDPEQLVCPFRNSTTIEEDTEDETIDFSGEDRDAFAEEEADVLDAMVLEDNFGLENETNFKSVTPNSDPDLEKQETFPSHKFLVWAVCILAAIILVILLAAVGVFVHRRIRVNRGRRLDSISVRTTLTEVSNGRGFESVVMEMEEASQ